MLSRALSESDLAAVKAIAANGGATEGRLARAALDYWWARDSADDELARAAADAVLSAEERRQATILLAGSRLRESRYADVVTLLDAALPDEANAGTRADLRQTRDFAAPLAGAPAMQAAVPAADDAPLSLDATSHMRAMLGVNAGELDAIVDTGSGVSTISQSDARRLGLRSISGRVQVGTATSAAATTNLAIADRVTIGGAEFRNVVFLVMPDAALTFANGAYVVHGIIGLPLLRRLGRLEFTRDREALKLHFSRTQGIPGADSNLMLEADEPFTFAVLEGHPGALRFFIDNGAPHSHLNRRFASRFADVIAKGRRQAVTTTGGAGAETQDDAVVLPSLTLRVAGRDVTIANVPVIEDRSQTRDGDFGLDVLLSGAGFVLDFDAMRFELLAAR